MAVTISANAKANIRQKTAADLIKNLSQPVINRYEALSTASQTSISLPFIVEQSNTDAFYLYIDGKLMRLGSSNDFVFSAIDGANGSSLITLNTPIAEGLNIIAIKAGIKKETENLTDARFTQIYDMEKAGFQGFIDESSKLTAVSGTPAAGQFRTFGIVNRAQIPDIANDLRARIAIDRFQAQIVQPVQNETGPNGEPVWAILNDDRNLIRCVGAGWINLNNAFGPRPYSDVQNDYVEIVFYGTGLNYLGLPFSTSMDWRVTIDGGSESANVASASYSTVLNSRGYPTNQILNLASGLSLGIHTIKIRNNNTTGSNNGLNFYGFEILNEASTINVRPGTSYANGTKRVLSAAQSLAYNSSFDSILRDGATVSSLSTKGARVIVYQKSDGTIGKAALETNSSSVFYPSADHTNEEMVRQYGWREFGAARSDDFSRAQSNSVYAFTLDDGTATLVGNAVGQASQLIGTYGDYLQLQSNGAFFTLTFVGTGLDILTSGDGVGSPDTHSFIVDGTTVASGIAPAVTIGKDFITKIASGLPYGTHTFKLLRTAIAGGSGFNLKSFRVYGPKKPTLPAGAIELADYNIMADFVANSTAGVETIATGVLRKHAERENIYVGAGWTQFGVDVTRLGGFSVYQGGSGQYVEYTFFGTGFDFRGVALTTLSNNVTAQLQNLTSGGSLNNITAANFPTATFSAYGGFSFASPPTLVLNNSNTNGSGFRVSGLPLAVYKLRLTNNTANNMSIDTFDIITPIHSPKPNFQADLQNTLPIGSCALSDNRRLSPVKSESPGKAWAQALGVATNPTTGSSSFIPVPELSLTVKTSGNPVEIVMGMSITNTSNNANIAIYVDGVMVGLAAGQGTGSTARYLTTSVIVPLSAGTHKIEGCWLAEGGGTITSTSTGAPVGANRFIKAREI